jgi:hypothetical protein
MLVLIGVVLSAISILVMFTGMLTYISMLGAASRFSYGYYAVASTYSGWTVVASIISIIFMACIIFLMAKAINPLKYGKKSGWRLLFYALLLQAVSVIVSAIISLDVFNFIFGIIFGAIGIAIGAYLLFEIKSHFVAVGKGVKNKNDEQ